MEKSHCRLKDSCVAKMAQVHPKALENGFGLPPPGPAAGVGPKWHSHALCDPPTLETWISCYGNFTVTFDFSLQEIWPARLGLHPQWVGTNQRQDGTVPTLRVLPDLSSVPPAAGVTR